MFQLGNTFCFGLFIIYLCLPLQVFGADNQGFILKHNLNQPVRNSLSWNWIQLSEEDFSKFLKNGSRNNVALPQNHIISSRMKSWIDLMDQQLRQKFPQKLAGIPKPQTMVVRNKRANAFGVVVPTCYEIPFNLSDDQGSEIDELFINIRKNGKLTKRTAKDPCFKSDISNLKAALKFFNEQTDTSCRFSFSSNTVLAQNCSKKNSLNGVSRSKKTVILRVSNWIVVNTGLIAKMSTERALVGILAHELGHYYRAHGTSLANMYNFFYTLGSSNLPHRPKPDLTLQEFGQQAIVASKRLTNFLAFRPVDRQLLPSTLFLAAGDIASKSCRTESSCLDSCRDIKQLKSNPTDYLKNLHYFPFQEALDKEFYLEVEKKMQTCLTQLKIGNRPPMLHRRQINNSIRFPQWIPFFQEAPTGLKNFLRGSLMGIAQLVGQRQLEGINAWQVLMTIKNLLEKKKGLFLKNLKSAYNHPLGWYTPEQEADEWSVETLSLIGFNTDAAVEAYLQLGQAVGKDKNRFYGFSIGSRQCRQFYQNGWIDQESKPMIIPVGSFVNIHHSICFRAFNVDREIKIHNYPIIDRADEPTVSVMNWDQVKNLAYILSN